MGQAAALDQVGAEAADPFREDLDVALAPPLAVGDLVEPGPLLEPDGAVDGGVQEVVGLGFGEPAGLPVEDHVPDPGRAWEAADHGRGEAHRAGPSAWAASPSGRRS